MRFHLHSEPGGKPLNEDYVLVRQHPMMSGMLLCFLADGQGGRANGAQAARVACETAIQLTRNSAPADLLEPAYWEDLLDDVDVEVGGTEGFTTLVAAAVTRESVTGRSCGDSKLYHFSRGTGIWEEWTSRQLRNPPVGSSECQFTMFHQDVDGGDSLLIVSDGVWKYCGYEALQSAFALTDLSTVAAHLRTATLARAGQKLPDDFSLIALDFR